MGDIKEDNAGEFLRSNDEGVTLRCRFYENQYPEPEEVVMVNVTEIGEMGAYVTLLEYDNIEVWYSTSPMKFFKPYLQIIYSIGHDFTLRAFA